MEVEQSKADLIRFVNEFTRRNINVKTLERDVDTSTPAGKIVLQIFQALDEYSQEINRKVDNRTT